MDTESLRWPGYETRFMEVAEKATLWEGKKPDLASAAFYLCLFGENGMPEQAELDLLETIATSSGPVYRLEVETPYWQEIILVVPQPSYISEA